MTDFDTVIDMALTICNDYKIAKIYNNDEDAFKQYVDKFLISAVPNFWQCEQSLDYDIGNRTFSSTLTSLEISILADFWVIAWWQKETNDATQIAQKLRTTAFQFDGVSSQNFKEKQNIIDKLREEVSRKITEYQITNINKYSY